MLDSELIPFIGQAIESFCAELFPQIKVEVIQEAQPTQQGVPSVPTLTFIKFPDRTRGWPHTEYSIEPDGTGKEKLVQLYETSIQISSLKWQDPSSDQVVTASDLLNAIMLRLTMQSTIQAFRKANVGILRVTEVTNEPFENDTHRFEFHPTFVIVLCHKREVEVSTEFVTRIEGEIFEVK